jgi:hypothetical protein
METQKEDLAKKTETICRGMFGYKTIYCSRRTSCQLYENRLLAKNNVSGFVYFFAQYDLVKCDKYIAINPHIM